MFKGLITIALATGATVLILSLFADNPAVADSTSNDVNVVTKDVTLSPVPNADTVTKAIPATVPVVAKEEKAVEKKDVVEPVIVEKNKLVADATHPTAPKAPTMEIAAKPAEMIAPAAPSGPFMQTAEVTSPNNEKGAENTTAETAPIEPIPVAPGVVSMDMKPQVVTPTAATEEKQVRSDSTDASEVKNISAPAKPAAPTPMEKPAEMAASQPRENGHAPTGNTTSSMSMPSMNMNMPQVNMPAVNMNMPSTSVGTKAVAPQVQTAPQGHIQTQEKPTVEATSAQPAAGH